MLGWANFITIFNIFTREDQKRKGFVDCMLEGVLYDNISTLKCVVWAEDKILQR